MKKWEPWINGIAYSIFFAMFFIDLPLEIIFQILWANGYKEFGFWIENTWKMLLVVSVVVSPFVGYLLYKKEQIVQGGRNE